MKFAQFLNSAKFRIGSLLGVIIAQFLFGIYIAVALFYRVGAYFLDAGFYVFAIASSKAPTTPLLVQQAWGDSVLDTHTTFLPMLINAILRVALPIPLNFIAYLGLQQLVVALAGAGVLSISALLLKASVRNIWTSAMAGAVLFPLSNAGIGSVAYPHVEAFGSALVAIGVCVLIYRWMGNGRTVLTPVSFVLMFLGMMAREDIGGHLAIAVFAALLCVPIKKIGSEQRKKILVLMLFGAGVTLSLLLFQRFVMHTNGAFKISYSGNPPYAHITSVWYLVERTFFLISNRMDLMGGLIAFTVIGFATKRREFFAFPLAIAPWLILNLSSVDPSKNSLGIYGLFPVIIYFCAPLIAIFATNSLVESDSESKTGERSLLMRVAYLSAFASLFIGGIASPPTGGGYIYYSLARYPLIGPGEISLTNKLVREFANTPGAKAVDDAVMSINPVVHESTPLVSKIVDYSQIEEVMFFPTFLMGQQSVMNLLQGWIDAGYGSSIKCLPGGLVQATRIPMPTNAQVSGQARLDAALRCHDVPTL